MNLGMGSGRPAARGREPTREEKRAALIEDPYAGMPFRRGSIVATPDGTRARVVAVRSDGDERVIEAIDGARAGARQAVPLRGLTLIEGPPEPKPAEAPEPSRPACSERAAEGWAKMSSEQRQDRYGGQERTGGPVIVQGDFTPEMFAVRGQAPCVLEGGPFDGVQLQVPSSKVMQRVPAPDPDGGPNYVPARYTRTRRRDAETDLVIFVFDGYDVPAPEPAAAG